MKFTDLDQRMRVYETAHDLRVLPGIYIVARLDGRSFTKLTKDSDHEFEAPFDERFRDLMLTTTQHVMRVGFNVIYAYTQSDEISLLFALADDGFDRKLRKINSVLAGEASSVFSIALGAAASFDCRVSQLPTKQDVVDYFRWRQSDAHRNALNGHCYWILRRADWTARSATRALRGMSVADKNEMLFQRGLNFNDTPLWQRRGLGVRWETYEKEGHNPVTDETVVVDRRRLATLDELPMGDDYTALLVEMLA